MNSEGREKYYFGKLMAVKSIIRGMADIKDGFDYIESFYEPGENQSVRFISEGMEIIVNEPFPEKDVLCVMVLLSPVESENSSYVPDDVHYLYEIEEERVKRYLLVTPTAPGMKDEREESEDTLDELIAVLLEFKEFY